MMWSTLRRGLSKVLAAETGGVGFAELLIATANFSSAGQPLAVHPSGATAEKRGAFCSRHCSWQAACLSLHGK